MERRRKSVKQGKDIGEVSVNRIYHHYSKLEENGAGMWKSFYGEEREEFIKKAFVFTGDAELYGSFMLKVIETWPFSCEHNLTCTEMNRQAWIGHAACCLAIGCPEDITRIAWHMLTKDQQDRANLKADEAIKKWEMKCQKDTLQMTFF